MAPAPSSSTHVAVVAFPFSSHAALLLSFARALAAAATPGTTLSFLSTASSIAQLRRTPELPGNLRFVEVPDGMTDDDAAAVPMPRRMELFMAAAEAGGMKAGIEAARGAAGGVGVTCVVGDAFVWPAAEGAANVGAPWVPVWTAASCALLAHVHTDALREDVGDQGACCLVLRSPPPPRWILISLPREFSGDPLPFSIRLVIKVAIFISRNAHQRTCTLLYVCALQPRAGPTSCCSRTRA